MSVFERSASILAKTGGPGIAKRILKGCWGISTNKKGVYTEGIEDFTKPGSHSNKTKKVSDFCEVKCSTCYLMKPIRNTCTELLEMSLVIAKMDWRTPSNPNKCSRFANKCTRFAKKCLVLRKLSTSIHTFIQSRVTDRWLARFIRYPSQHRMNHA